VAAQTLLAAADRGDEIGGQIDFCERREGFEMSKKFAHLTNEQLAAAIKQARKDVKDWFDTRADAAAQRNYGLADKAFREHRKAQRRLRDLGKEQTARWKKKREELRGNV